MYHPAKLGIAPESFITPTYISVPLALGKESSTRNPHGNPLEPNTLYLMYGHTSGDPERPLFHDVRAADGNFPAERNPYGLVLERLQLDSAVFPLTSR